VEASQPIENPRRELFQLSTLMAVGLTLFLLLLPFHLVLKKLLPDPVGTYWKEMLLGLLVLLWAIRCLCSRRVLLSGTPLDWPVLVYLGLLLVRFALDRSGWVGAWGLYVSVMYLPLFWLVPTVLRQRTFRPRSGQALQQRMEHPRTFRPRLPRAESRDSGRALRGPSQGVTALIALLVGVGGMVALGGLAEFVLDVSLWPSDEIIQRLGFPDFYIYSTHVRRVYFTFDSPTTLANTLALLLPLALTLPSALSAQWRGWARLAAGLAATLMVACIVVTFSRGIWVATVVALLVMGVLSGFVQRNWQILLVAAGALALIGLVWGLVSTMHLVRAATADQGVVEFSPAAYYGVPVSSFNQELLMTEPTHGQVVTQTWTLFDPIAGCDDTRCVLYEHPPESGKEEIIYRVEVPEAGALRFSIALSPDVWSPEKGDGATFQVYVADPDASQEGRFVFVRYINPKHNPSDRRWRNFLVDLSPWAGRTVNLSLITTGGPAGDWAFDWGGWAELQVVGVEPDVFAAARSENVVLRHTASVLDWVRDETNRDRLAAWRLALGAWRGAPLWGNGLGSTGVAALRTHPGSAFVTESQVLKALVELGLPGLLALGFLWFQVGRVGLRAYRTADDPARRTLLLGILTGLLIIFIEGWVYQNLEVKQVNAYFWTLVGTLAFLGGGRNGDG
jgi:hypothetical protein